VRTHAVKDIALLVNAAVERATLLRRAHEDREKADVSATHSARLGNQLVYLELLALDRIIGPSNLVGPGRVAISAVERGQLRFQPLAYGILQVLRLSERARRQGNGGSGKSQNDSPHDNYSSS
jgi:hypothetical protein